MMTDYCGVFCLLSVFYLIWREFTRRNKAMFPNPMVHILIKAVKTFRSVLLWAGPSSSRDCAAVVPQAQWFACWLPR